MPVPKLGKQAQERELIRRQQELAREAEARQNTRQETQERLVICPACRVQQTCPKAAERPVCRHCGAEILG